MKLVFRQGPWDGVTLEAEIAPDYIQFEHWIHKDDSEGIEFQPRTHHAYKRQRALKGTALYRYAPGEKGDA